MFPAPQKLGKAHFGVSTFFASAHPTESCGSNGLPLTPNSIKIIGRAPALYKLNNPYLCCYVDVLRGKHERIIAVQEFYPLNLTQACQQYKFLRSVPNISKFCFQILQSLAYLNNLGTVCANLSPENILVTPEGDIKLYQYGLYHLTDGGSAVSFPIGVPKYSSPDYLEYYSNTDSISKSNNSMGSQLWDTWSLGLIVLEILMEVMFFENSSAGETVKEVLTLASESCDFVEGLVVKHNCQNKIENMDTTLLDFLRSCLTVDATKRSTPNELLQHKLFSNFSSEKKYLNFIQPQFPVIDSSLCITDFSQYKSNSSQNERHASPCLLGYPEVEDRDNARNGKASKLKDTDHLAERSLHEIYHLWQLVGGNVKQELKKQKLIRTQPSILNLPNITITEGEIFGGGFARQDVLPSSTIMLPLQNLRKKLAHIPAQKYYPLITQGENNTDDLEARKLPLVIREKDAEYQFHRIVMFERLLKAYPYKADSITKEARKDIPPFYRSYIWASLLKVDGNVAEIYQQIDKHTPTSTDRQIEVDIPRCHQYDELLSSPRGHAKFARILKAWVVSHPSLVYWQGLDSLCAPFLYLNFENEALAYSCLTAFINKYLGNFFLRDNSAVIQEYLAKFSHLIAFQDPQLYNHLHNIGFIPELYAIPWFLTMFTHVFPLHKIFLLWDTLLLGGSSLPLCVGVALMRQLKDRLLQFGFNECILLFSDMPDINMEQAVHDAVEIFCSTPASITYRHFDGSHKTRDQDSELHMSNVEIHDLKKEMCGRISGAELLDLMYQRRNKSGRDKVVILDVRPHEEYAKGSLSGAISFPADFVLTADEEISAAAHEQIVPSFKGKILVVIGSSSNHSQLVTVANALLQHGFPRVCTLHGGIEIFRSSGHIVIS